MIFASYSSGGRAAPRAVCFASAVRSAPRAIRSALLLSSFILHHSSFSALAALPPLYGDLRITNVIEHTAGQSYTLQGTYTDRTIRGYTVAEIAVGDLIATEDSQGYVDPWLITNILVASGSALSAQVQHAGAGATNAPMSGVMAIVCAVSSNIPLPPDAANAAISEYLALGARNYALQLLALRESRSGTGITDAPADGKLYGRQDAAWVEVPTSAPSADAAAWSTYPQTNLIYRVLNDGGTNIVVANSGLTNEFTLNYLGGVHRDYEGVDAAGRTNYIFREYNQYHYGSGGTNWLWYYEEAEPPHETVYYAHMTNAAAFPTGTWYQGDAAQEPPLTPSGDVTRYGVGTYSNTYGLDSNGVFRVKTRDVLTEIDGKVGVTDAAYTNALALSGSALQSELDPRLPAHGTAGNLLQSSGSAWQSWTPNYLTAMTFGTTSATAYRGDHGAAVSNLAYSASTNAEAAKVLGAAALPKTFTNAAAVTTLKITGGGPSYGEIAYASDSAGGVAWRHPGAMPISITTVATNRLSYTYSNLGFYPVGVHCSAVEANTAFQAHGFATRAGVAGYGTVADGTGRAGGSSMLYLYQSGSKNLQLNVTDWGTNSVVLTFTGTATGAVQSVYVRGIIF